MKAKGTTWTPERKWEGQDAFLIGGGHSLLTFDFKWLIGKKTIGCNAAYLTGEDVVKVCLFSDSKFYQKNVFPLQRFAGLVVSICPSLTHTKLDWLKKMRREEKAIIGTGDALALNGSTGAAAINLALSLGVKRAFLLGYDLCRVGHKTHWHGHYGEATKTSSFERFRKGFERLAKAIPGGRMEIYNVSDGTSKLECFETITHEIMFEMHDERNAILA